MGLLSRYLEADPYGAVPAWQRLAFGASQNNGGAGFQPVQAQQQAPMGYGPGWSDWQRRQQPQPTIQYRATQQPQRQPQAPQLPSLTAAPNGQPMGPDPFAPAPIAPQAQAMPQMKEGPTQDPNAPQGFMARFSKGMANLPENPFWQLGTALLSNAENGGNWGAAFQDFGNTRDQRQRTANEQRRLAVAEKRDDTMWNRQEQQFGSLEQWVSTLPPDQQAAARANPQAAHAAYMEMQAQANAPITPFQQAQLRLDERQLNETAAARRQAQAYQQSQDQWMRRFQGALGAADASTVAEQGALVNRAVTTVRPILQEMRSIIERYPSIMGSWINTNDRTQLVRLAGGDPERLAAMERFQGLATQLTLPQLEMLRPATNLDFERVRSTVADPQMSQRGALAYLDSQLQELDRSLAVQNSQGQWIAQYGSLSLPNETGQTWAQTVNDAPFMQYNSRSPESIGGGSAGGGANGFGQRRATPTREDVQMLRQNTSAERRRQFDEIYGPGAAARVLGGNDRIRVNDRRTVGGSLR